MRKQLIAAVLALVTGGAASAQVTGSSGGDTNVRQANPATIEVAALSGDVTNTFQPGPAIDQSGSFSLGPILSEPLGLGTNLWLSDKLALDEEEGWPFVDPDAIQLQGEAFSQEFNLLRRDKRGEPVFFRRDKDIKFVEHHENRTGVPAPIGMTYPMPQKRFEFFAEFAPIFDAAPNESLGWGGGLGIRFFIGK